MATFGPTVLRLAKSHTERRDLNAEISLCIFFFPRQADEAEGWKVVIQEV